MQGSLAERLRVLRARQGLSLTEASKRAGITRDTLSDLERGKRHAYMPTLAKIAEGYGVPVEELLEEPALASVGKDEAPDTGLTALSPAELETRVFGAPVREGEEPKPVIGVAEADALARQILSERNALVHGPGQGEDAEVLTLRAQLYRLFLIDVRSKLADPRNVPFKGVSQLAGLADETVDAVQEEPTIVPQSADTLKRCVDLIKHLKKGEESQLERIRQGQLDYRAVLMMRLANKALRTFLNEEGILQFAEAVRAGRELAEIGENKAQPLCRALLRELRYLEELVDEAHDEAILRSSDIHEEVEKAAYFWEQRGTESLGSENVVSSDRAG
jgi:transcriptional regulator with XRE-family HTH domain